MKDHAPHTTRNVSSTTLRQRSWFNFRICNLTSTISIALLYYRVVEDRTPNKIKSCSVHSTKDFCTKRNCTYCSSQWRLGLVVVGYKGIWDAVSLPSECVSPVMFLLHGPHPLEVNPQTDNVYAVFFSKSCRITEYVNGETILWVHWVCWLVSLYHVKDTL